MSEKLEELVKENTKVAGWALVALALVVVVLLVLLWRKPAAPEKFTANTVRQQDSDQDFYREKYINLEGQQDRAGSYFAANNADLPQLGRIDLKDCKVSELANADPYLWMYQGLQAGQAAEAGKAAPALGAGALMNTSFLPAGLAKKEGMSDAELGAAMAGGDAKTGIVAHA